MKPNTLEDLCKVMERLREENANVGRLAFTLPGIARVELTFPHDSKDIVAHVTEQNGIADIKLVFPRDGAEMKEETVGLFRVSATAAERDRMCLAVVMIILVATSYVMPGSGFAMLAFGVQMVSTTWAIHEWFRAIGRIK
jgi:hypothetical protein